MINKNEAEELKAIKIKLMNELIRQSHLTVLHGAFKGKKLSRDSYWGGTDLSTKILGCYEQEVQSILQRLSSDGYKYLIDIGAGDGFYAVGALYANLFGKVLAYERAVKARENIIVNMKLNNINSERYWILPKSDGNTIYSHLEKYNINLSELVVLIDIEGDEYQLIDDIFLEKFSSSVIIVEIHRQRVLDIYDTAPLPENLCLQDELNKFRLLVKNRKIERVFRSSYQIDHTFGWFNSLSDDERLLLLSENRDTMQEWWIIYPNG
ncbi:hypothetical protein [Shewanella surugensis]|uniref:FkbM family methyltransferase n=1 Tax=Shewanella surugensis TaxID=212020 RepID=A0ABT0LH42_9GAMM|nr:hypothetical protein [Shewanella surugensis]MCL1127004.1 hypothetical protein [Shewanella surugensis]